MTRHHVGEMCIPNIGARGRRRRLAGGIAWAVVGLAIAIAMLLRAVPWPMGALLMIPFTLAALGVFQAREKT